MCVCVDTISRYKLFALPLTILHVSHRNQNDLLKQVYYKSIFYLGVIVYNQGVYLLLFNSFSDLFRV